ncbi:MAG: type 1 glutamine amidotransferase [Paracoccaceae bacterium]
MRIGILQCGHTPDLVAERHGAYAAMFDTLFAGEGLDFRVWNVVDMDFPDGPDAAEGWLVTGSRHGVYDDLPFIAPLEQLVRDIHAADKPMVGICFGHQIIAQALGGHVEKFAGGWSVGHRTYHWDGLGDIALNAWHQDQVITPPPGARTIAGNDFTRHAALLYGDSILTVQPHPEFPNDIVRTYTEAYGGSDRYPPGTIEAAVRTLDQPVDDRRIGHLMAEFLKHRTLADV